MIKKIFSSPISPPCRAVKLVIEAINLKEFKFEELNILTKQYLQSDLVKVNPQHTVPTMQDENHIIWDSHAIAAYLVNKYGKIDYMYPQDYAKRSLVDQRMHFDGSVLYPTLCNAIYPILFHKKAGITQQDRAKFNKAYHFMDNFLGNKPWLCGAHITIADLCCISSVSTMDFVHPVSKSNYPNLYEFLKRCQNLPMYDKCNQTGLDQLGVILQEKVMISRASIR